MSKRNKLLSLCIILLSMFLNTKSIFSYSSSLELQSNKLHYIKQGDLYLTYFKDSNTVDYDFYSGDYNQRWFVYKYNDDSFSLFNYEILKERFGEDIETLPYDSSINSLNEKLRINSSGEPLRFKKQNNTLVISSKANQDIKQYLGRDLTISGDNVSSSNDYTIDYFVPIEIEEYSTALIVVPGALGSELFYQNNKIFGPNLYTIEQNKTNPINLMSLLNNMFSKLYFHEQDYRYPNRTNQPVYQLSVTNPIIFTTPDKINSNDPYLQYTNLSEFKNENNTCISQDDLLTRYDLNNQVLLGTYNNYCVLLDELASNNPSSNQIAEEIAFFSYDWRNFSALAATKLQTFINNRHYIDIKFIGRSYGGFVIADYLADSTSNINKVEQVHILGTPFEGSPVVLGLLENGNPSLVVDLNTFIDNNLGILEQWYIEDKVRSLTENLPCVYQLIPTKRYYNLAGPFVAKWLLFSGWRKYNFEESYNILSQRGWARYISNSYEEQYSCDDGNGGTTTCTRSVYEYSTKDLWNQIANQNSSLVTKYYMHNGVLTDQHIISRVPNHHIYLSSSVNTTKGELRLNSLELYDAMGNTIGDGITPYNAVSTVFDPSKVTDNGVSHMKFIEEAFIEKLIVYIKGENELQSAGLFINSKEGF